MIIVFKCQRIDTRINSERLTDRDALSASCHVIGAASIQIGVINDIVLLGQILLDIIVKVVVIIVANVVTGLFLADAALQIVQATLVLF